MSWTGIVGGRILGEGASRPGLITYRTTTIGDNAFPAVSYLRLPAAGDGAGILARVWGFEHGTMNRGFFRVQEGAFNRNAFGSVTNFQFAFNPGYTDEAAPPWTTGGIPSGWGADAMWQADNELQIILGSNDGRVIDWAVQIQVFLFGGAVLLMGG